MPTRVSEGFMRSPGFRYAIIIGSQKHGKTGRPNPFSRETNHRNEQSAICLETIVWGNDLLSYGTG
jgi:hypothetical protein